MTGDAAGQQLRVPAQQRRGDRLRLRVEHLLVGGGKRRADVVGQALVRDPVHRHPGLAVLDDVPAQLIQHPRHVVTAEPAAYRAALAQASHSSSGSPAPNPQVSAASRPRRPPSVLASHPVPGAHLGQVGVERVLDRVAHLVLPARLGGVDRRRRAAGR